MELYLTLILVAVFIVTYVACWVFLGPLAESKGYTVTYQRAIPVVNIVGVVVFLVLPRRSPRRRLLTPEQQQRNIRLLTPEQQQRNIRVTRPDERGRYR